MENKPWYASQTVWASLSTIGVSLGGAYLAYKAGDINLAMTSLIAAGSGVGSLVGRFKATASLGKPAVAKPAV
jgi:hypothetical protein